MATFQTLRQILGERLNIDETITANATRLNRMLNLAQDSITGRYDWTFLEERDLIQTVVDKTAGTVSMTNGSTTVTGTSTAFASGDVGKFIKFEGNDDWYEVTAFTSTTALTINPSFGQDTDTSMTYTLRKIYYSLDTDVNRILSVKQYNTPIKLTQVAAGALDRAQPNITATGAPTAYALFRLDPTITSQYGTQRQLQFYPSPNDEYNIEVRYIKLLSELSGNSDISQIPQQFHDVLIDLAEYYGSKFINDSMSKQSALLAQAEAGIRRMKEEDSSHGDYFPVLQPSDGDDRESRFLPFPSTFEQPG